MAGKAGRIEAQITYDANVTCDVTESGSHAGAPFTVTITAGSYYLVELVTAFNAQLTTGTMSISDGETAATGLSTISASSGTIAIAWTSTTLRDAFGFSGAVAAAASTTSSRACPGVWLPGCPAKFTRRGDSEAGEIYSTVRQTMSPPVNGVSTVYTIGGGTAYGRDMEGLLFEGVPGSRIAPHLATYTNETLEEFLGNTFYGSGTYASLFSVGASNRIYWDADVDGTYKAGKFLWPNSYRPEQMFRGWTGRYVVPFPRFLVGS